MSTQGFILVNGIIMLFVLAMYRGLPKIVRRVSVNLLRWGIAIPLILKTTSMMFRTQPFASQEEAQAYMFSFLLMIGSVLGWMLLTIYLFPDDYTREDNLSRWLAKRGLSWRVE